LEFGTYFSFSQKLFLRAISAPDYVSQAIVFDATRWFKPLIC